MNRVVVIDDYEPSLRMYSAAIEKMLGGEVVAFSDPHAALHYLSGVQPTLLVVDYNMPEMDGISFVQEMRGVPGRERSPSSCSRASTTPACAAALWLPA